MKVKYDLLTKLSNIFSKKSDIKDNLTSTDTDKPLSANQGKVLNTAISGKASSDHKHGNIENNGVLKVSGTAQASKNVCTDASGNITAEAKNNHTHNYIPNNADGSTTGNLTATTSGKGVITANKFVKNEGTTSQFLKANGDVDSNTYVHTGGTNLTRAGNTLNHDASGVGDPLTTATLKNIKYDSQGHITGVADASIGSTSGNIITTGTGGKLQSSNKITSDKVLYSITSGTGIPINNIIADIYSLIDDSVSTYQLSITNNTNYIKESSFVYLTKVGRFCFVEFSFVSKTTLPASGNSIYDTYGYFKIGTITDSDFIPPSPKYFDTPSYRSDYCEIRLQIKDNGEVWIKGTPSKNYNSYGSGIYSFTSTYNDPS